MSILVCLLACDACGETIRARPYLSAVYSVPDGKQLPLRWTLGWCNSCDRAGRMENWPADDELDRDVAAVILECDTRLNSLDPWKQAKLDEIETYRRLQPYRTTPNRCLDCGSADMRPWSFDGSDNPTSSPHRDCPGMFQQLDDPDAMRLLLVDESDVYAINGTRLGRVPNDL